MLAREEHDREELRRHLARKDAPTRRAARIASGAFAGEVLERLAWPGGRACWG